ncbi:MAG: metal transporter substrate-binding protein [Amycolatopsis sp.]|jgi:zinc/manganese transport system substrate-binding protein|uniref:metal ABC transporter solute-binding protein, Zn/Mn family n=1 Tax=Amycolatopsis sp. TaxID=37632 RepID=UPI002622016D|nr:zinc ABC transporter substrate-binding protein [Amycolatopsis sp.]MCU1683877.1 metal transporter substrate-binding protein [Amycolatopsis sp.]
MNPRRFPRALVAGSALAVLALGLAACSGGASANPGDDGKLKVVASTDVWGSVLSAVGGDKVQVSSIIHSPTADPHSYETTAADALTVQNAKLLLGNGGGYDNFFSKLVGQAAGAKNLVAYDIFKGTAATPDANEHVWYSLPGVEKVADQVAAQLGDIEPASKAVFTANATAFKGKVEDLFKRVTQLGVAHPGSKVVMTEPVAHYLLEAAKVTDSTPPAFSKAIESETDVPVAALEQVKQLITGKQVKALVNNAQTTTSITEQLVAGAHAAGVPVIDVTETLPADVTDYIGWMSKEVDVLAGALNS